MNLKKKKKNEIDEKNLLDIITYTRALCISDGWKLVLWKSCICENRHGFAWHWHTEDGKLNENEINFRNEKYL